MADLPKHAKSSHRAAKMSLPVLMVIQALSLAIVPAAWAAADTTPAQQLQAWSVQAGVTADAGRGKVFFTTKHGGQWSCSSCHGDVPVQTGKHASTGKLIEPLAPAANPKALTSTARIEKWFRRNCNDVLKRECSAAEKADVLAYLISVQP